MSKLIAIVSVNVVEVNEAKIKLHIYISHLDGER